MKLITRRNHIKDEMVNLYRTLKEYFKIHSNDEEILYTIIQQLAETIANSEYSNSDSKSKKIYENYLLNSQIKKQEEKALYEIMLHKGTLS
ncbi:MAG: hypothetical protein H7645_08025 [Candidatus Heimdallarchaeota archaeon]|nr:hypothetical protein [Candidatus Heimdallarchaeota archaeon]MCK4770270.1 hypothetical protein [Candidatus Heimdallarchaeota archaeon]